MIKNVFLFYKNIRESLFNGSLSKGQVDGIDWILLHWTEYISKADPDIRKLAYVLATVYHETAKTMRPIEEYGKGKGLRYGRKVKHSGKAYATPDKIYYGRGYVQLTWYENYELMGRLLNMDLLNQPELALQPDKSVRILFEGMYKGSSSFGDFTGKCLEMYFNSTTDKPVAARYIINGQDAARTIAGYHAKFLAALTA